MSIFKTQTVFKSLVFKIWIVIVMTFVLAMFYFFTVIYCYFYGILINILFFFIGYSIKYYHDIPPIDIPI